MECLSPSAQVVEAVPAKLSNESETLTGRKQVHIMQMRLFKESVQKYALSK